MPVQLRLFGCAMFLSIITPLPGLSQDQAGDLQHLKQKLQQLEKMMASLQQEIAAIEQAQKPPAVPVPVTSTPAAVPPPQLPVTYIGDETRTRETDLDYPPEAPRIDNEELDPTLRGYFRVPGTQTLIRLSGLRKRTSSTTQVSRAFGTAVWLHPASQ